MTKPLYALEILLLEQERQSQQLRTANKLLSENRNNRFFKRKVTEAAKKLQELEAGIEILNLALTGYQATPDAKPVPATDPEFWDK